MDRIAIGILTISDSCFQGTAVDSSGPNLSAIIKSSEFSSVMVVEATKCVPDDSKTIEETLIFWADEWDLNVIITTGGTGFGPRDVTPEATKRVIDRETPGLAQLMLTESLKITPFASLYRGVCGMRKQTLIINTPGSKKASAEFLLSVIKCIPHAVAVMMDIKSTVTKDHEAIQKGNNHGSCSHAHSKVDVSRVARRLRNHHDVYPMIDYEAALLLVLENCISTQKETIDLMDEQARSNAVGRVLAESVVASEPFPGFRASIKDGYAVRAIDGVGVRRVVDVSTAGSSPKDCVNGENEIICFRISTGAPVPEGMDAVVQVEDTELVEEADDGRREVAVNILVEPVVGQDIRKVGSDIAIGQCVVEAGKAISSTEMGLFATLDIKKVTVFRHPEIGIMSTGDELVDPWTEMSDVKPGCIRDSNKVTLMHLLKSKGFETVNCGTALDSPNDVFDKLSNAFSKVDVLITTGSVSMGEKDLLKKNLQTDFGAQIHFGRVNMKPGKPVTFATLTWKGKKKMVFSLPGNPSSAAVTTHVLVFPALLKISGSPDFHPKIINVQLECDVHLDSRPEFMRAVLTLHRSEGEIKVLAEVTGNQISSRLASLKEANGLLHMPSRSDYLTMLDRGSIVRAVLIGELFIDSS